MRSHVFNMKKLQEEREKYIVKEQEELNRILDKIDQTIKEQDDRCVRRVERIYMKTGKIPTSFTCAFRIKQHYYDDTYITNGINNKLKSLFPYISYTVAEDDNYDVKIHKTFS